MEDSITAALISQYTDLGSRKIVFRLYHPDVNLSMNIFYLDEKLNIYWGVVVDGGSSQVVLRSLRSLPGDSEPIRWFHLEALSMCYS